MASIEKMSIRGVRSFSPDKDETIEFYSPLTMIVGANGCGKTTIIESLKYSCTGCLPPGARNGQSFVNDPSVTDTTEVKASIKLQFRNRAGYPSVVTRSLQVLKKRNKLEFKALDGVIRSTNAQNEKVSSSQKCSDLDRMVPEMLGVSPAILENVIFCHQEDSNWPMQEGLVLKKKFDDVFESTRYAKALDAFAKAKKEFSDKAKDLKVELAELSAHLTSANDSKRELALCEENQEACQTELISSEEKIGRLDDKIQRSTAIIASCQGAAAEMKELRWRISESERRVAEKRAGLERVYKENDDDLNSLMLNFDAAMSAKTMELRSLQRAVDLMQQEISSLRNSTDDLNIKKGQGESLKMHMADEQARLLKEFGNASRKFGLSAPPTVWTSANSRQFIQALNRKVDSLLAETSASINQCREAVSRQEKEFMQSRGALQKLDMELDNKRSELRRNVAESDRKRSELAQLASARSSLQAAERDFESAKAEHDDFVLSFPTKSADLKRQQKEVTDEIRSITEAMSTDAALLTEMHLNRHEMAGLAATERQIEQDGVQISAEVTALFGLHREALDGAAAPVSVNDLTPIASGLSQRTIDVKRQLSTHKEELLKVRSDLSGVDALLKQERDRLVGAMSKSDTIRAQKDRGLRDCVFQVNALRRGEILAPEFDDRENIQTENLTLEALVLAAEDTEERAYEYKSIFEASRVFLRKLEKARKKVSGACPCCHRTMGPDVTPVYEDSVKKLFNFRDLNGSEEDYKRLHEEAKAVTIKAKQLERTLQPWTALQSEIDGCNARIADLSPRSRDLQDQEDRLKGRVSELEQRVAMLEKASASINEVKARWFAHAQRLSELLDRKKRQTQSLMCSGSSSVDNSSGSTRTIEEMEEQQRKRTDRKEELIVKKDKLTTEENNLTKRMFHFKGILAETEKVLLSAKQRGQRYAELEASMKAANTEIEQIELEIRSVASRREESNRQMNEVEIVLRSLQAELRTKEQGSSAKIEEIKSSRDLVTRLTDSVEDTERRFREVDLEGVSVQLDSIQARIMAKEDELRTQTPRIQSINSEITSQERTRRQVKENIDLRQMIVDHDKLTEALTALDRRIGSKATELTAAQRELERAEQEKRRLTSERDKLVGNLEIYLQQSDELRAKLQGANYRGVEDRFRKKNIQYETTMMAVADLASYYEALDKALQNFHLLKIREINKIIRELWQLIYKGQDIDMIELESGQEPSEAGAATAIKGRRAYHYRVVMRKGDVPLDMRGRCSAGQRVLAAIVIRLALAETFCLNCGILALDEPTTNLDEPNKAGLAHALARIIVSRSKQQNFQLICITHDEEFVRMMGTELAGTSDFSLPEYYFRVSREEAGGRAGAGKYFSRIDRISWEDM